MNNKSQETTKLTKENYPLMILFNNEELTTQQYPQNSLVESQPNITDANSEPEQTSEKLFPKPLPQTYYSDTQKITFYDEGGLKIDIHTFAGSSSYTVTGKMYENQILMDDNPARFELNDKGGLWVRIPGETYYQLSTEPQQ